MDSNLLQERMDAKKAMDKAQAEYDEAKEEYKEAKEAFTEEWKKKNPAGSKAEMLDYLSKVEICKEYSAAVESCRSTYDKLVETYNGLVKKMPNPGTFDQEQFLSALRYHIKQAMKEEKESKVQMSEAKSSFVNNLLEDHKIKLLFMNVNETISQQLAVPEIIPFEWHSSKEDSEENRNSYIKYLNDTILCADLEYPMTVFDPTQQADLLDAEFNEDFAVTGTCDALISSTNDLDGMIHACHVIFELKKPTNKNKKTNQAILEFLSAGKRSTFPVIMVLTDLNDFWKLLWLEEIAPQNRQSHIARICIVEVSRNVAIGFLRYHLKLIAKMRGNDQTELSLDFKYDDEYQDDDEAPPKKKQRFISKSRPTFMASSYSAAVWAASDHSALNNYTKEQLMDIAVSNFIKDNKQDFKGLVKIKEKQELIPQTSGLTLVQDWLDNQDFP
jgi:hypothetical protein